MPLGVGLGLGIERNDDSTTGPANGGGGTTFNVVDGPDNVVDGPDNVVDG